MGGAALISFSFWATWRLPQHRAGRDFIEREQVVGWLIGSLMHERAA
jgi:hypothetical protein